MGEDATDWIDDEDTESDDDTADSEEEWHQVKDEEAAWAELDIATIQSRVEQSYSGVVSLSDNYQHKTTIVTNITTTANITTTPPQVCLQFRAIPIEYKQCDTTQ